MLKDVEEFLAMTITDSIFSFMVYVLEIKHHLENVWAAV